MELADIKKVHFVGVGGIGVSAIARFFSLRGVAIVGSDKEIPDSSVFPSGVYHVGHHAENVENDTSLLVYSPAVPSTNPERMRARELSIPELSYPEALALVTRDTPTIAVSGTHGKSSTTALLGKLFIAGGMDASVVVGADVSGFDHNYHHGKGDMFIVEACEYRRHMLKLNPQAILLTNLELDHPDYYHDLADIKQAFRDYIEKLSGEDLLIVNNDDANIRDITRNFDAIFVRYGIGEGADLYARNISQTTNEQTFELVWKGSAIGMYSTPLPGLYNVYNILASVATYLAYGGKTEYMQKVLSDFHGVGRRFEVLGTLGGEANGPLIISDYAHHPTALHAVVEAGLARYRGKNVLTVFRPHHRERTVKLMDDFVSTILAIPHTLLVEIYDVAGREEDTLVSSRDVIGRVLARDPRHDILYAKDIEEAEALTRTMAHQFDVILVVGAGDADLLARNLIK